jgi:taurine transport system permease protein
MAESPPLVLHAHPPVTVFAFFRKRVWPRLVPFVSIAAVLALWEIAAQAEWVMPFLLPKLSDVLVQVWADLVEGKYVEGLAITLYRTLAGFAIAAAIGVGVGILVARSRRLAWFFDPILSVMLPVPKFAVLPIFMLWFGIEDGSKIVLAAFTIVFQVAIAVWEATRAVEQKIIWSAQSLGAGERGLLWEIVLPAALPGIITSLQIAMPICFVVVLGAEFITSGGGLGDQMMVATRYSNSIGTFAALLEIAVTGYLILKGMEYLRRLLLPWHQESEFVTN